MADQIEGSVDTGNPETSGDWYKGLESYTVQRNDGSTVPIYEEKGWKSNADIVKSYMHLEKAVGANKVVLPGENDNILDWEGWDKLGVPKEADEYPLAAPEGFEQYDQGLSDDMRAVFHEAKLTPAQAQLIHDKYVERMGNTYSEHVTEAHNNLEKWEGELRKEYGTAYEERVAAAQSAMDRYGTDELKQLLTQTGLGSHPELVRAFVKAGMAMGKGPQFKDAETSGQFGITPDMAKEQIAAIRNNPGLMDRTHPEHKVLQEKLTRLNEIAWGTDPVAQAG